MNAKPRTYAERPDGPGFEPEKLVEYSAEPKPAAVLAQARALLKRKSRRAQQVPRRSNKSASTSGSVAQETPAKPEKAGRLSFITGGLIGLYTRMNEHWISKGGGNNRDVGSRSKLSP